MKALGISIANHITFKEFSIQWLNLKQDKAQRTIDAYNIILNNHLLPQLGRTRLRDLKPFHAETIKHELLDKKKLSASRVNNILTVLKSMMNDGVKHQNIVINPFKNVDFLPEQKKSLNYWLPHEVSKFLKANIDSPYYPLFLVCLNIGLRKSEAIGLCWDKVNFETKQIYIERSMDRYGLKETTKSKKRRVVPMNDIVYETLLKLRDNRKNLQFVFTDEIGKPVSYMHLGDRIFQRAIKKAGVKRIRLHDTRTTFSSNFCMQGGDIYALSKILGHSSVEITQERYAELHPEFLKKEANIINFSPENSPYMDLKVVN